MKPKLKIPVEAIPSEYSSKKRMKVFISETFAGRKYKLKENLDAEQNKIEFVFVMKELKNDFVTEISEITEAFQKIGELNMYEITSCDSAFI